jgi:hypothetical protein
MRRSEQAVTSIGRGDRGPVENVPTATSRPQRPDRVGAGGQSELLEELFAAVPEDVPEDVPGEDGAGEAVAPSFPADFFSELDPSDFDPSDFDPSDLVLDPELLVPDVEPE